MPKYSACQALFWQLIAKNRKKRLALQTVLRTVYQRLLRVACLTVLLLANNNGGAVLRRSCCRFQRNTGWFTNVYIHPYIFTGSSPNGAFQSQIYTTLRIPTGGRLTSWLFTSEVEEMKLGIVVQQVQGGIEPGLSDSKSSALTTRPRCLPICMVHL